MSGSTAGVLEAIRTRRTTKTFLPQRVDRALLEQVLEAAVWAPNHRLTEPWHFTVVQGETLERVAQLRGRIAAERPRPGGAEEASREEQTAYRKALAAPVSVVVSVAQHPDPAVREEDYAATAAAIQNMLLAAHALGLGAYWSTNELVRDARTLELLGIPAEQRIVGIVQLGYAAEQRQQKRTPAAERTRWLE